MRGILHHDQIVEMLDEAVECEMQFAEDILSGGISGLSIGDMLQYLPRVRISGCCGGEVSSSESF